MSGLMSGHLSHYRHSERGVLGNRAILGFITDDDIIASNFASFRRPVRRLLSPIQNSAAESVVHQHIVDGELREDTDTVPAPSLCAVHTRVAPYMSPSNTRLTSIVRS